MSFSETFLIVWSFNMQALLLQRWQHPYSLHQQQFQVMPLQPGRVVVQEAHPSDLQHPEQPLGDQGALLFV